MLIYFSDVSLGYAIWMEREMVEDLTAKVILFGGGCCRVSTFVEHLTSFGEVFVEVWYLVSSEIEMFIKLSGIVDCVIFICISIPYIF